MRADKEAAGQRSLPRAIERGGSMVVGVAARFACSIRRLAGMPDYQAYLEHLRRSHPETAAPTESEYYAEYLRSRYEDGPTRCC